MECKINRNFDKELRNFVSFDNSVNFSNDGFDLFKYYVVGLSTLKRLIDNKDAGDELLVREFINYYDISFDEFDFWYIINKFFDGAKVSVREMKTNIPVSYDDKYGMIKIVVAFKKGNNIDTRRTYSSSRVNSLLNKKRMIMLSFGDVYSEISKEEYDKFRVNDDKFISLCDLNDNQYIGKLLDSDDEYSKKIISILGFYIGCVDIEKDIVYLYKLFQDVFSDENLDRYQNESVRVLAKRIRDGE